MPRRRKYLVGVSGGCDSVVLLELLRQSGYRHLVVCHLDHQLRGETSRADARFVARLARRHGFAFDREVADVARIACERGVSEETAGRQERLAFFSRAARRHRCSRVVLAHHADDQVETVLMNLCRGAGSTGLAAMSRHSEHGTLSVFRPLLATWRSEIEAFAQENKIRFRTDETNWDTGLTRNRVRHHVIPELNRILHRDVREAVFRTAVIAEAEDDFLGTVAKSAMGEVQRPDGVLAARPLRGLHPAVARRVVRQWLAAHSVRDVSLNLVDAIITLADPTASPASLNLPGDRRVRRRSGTLFIEGQSPASPPSSSTA